MAVMQTPHSAWVEEGLRALAAGGPDAVRVEAVARSLGVTKGSFYWNFDDRRALLDAILDRWEQMSLEGVGERIEGPGTTAGVKLRYLLELASSSEEVFGIDLFKVDLAVRDWARREEAVAQRLRRVDNRRMDYLRSLFGASCDDEDEVEARCLLAFSLFVGSHFIAADNSGRSRAEVVEAAADLLLE